MVTDEKTFYALCSGLHSAREKAEKSRIDLFVAREKVKKITREEARYRRSYTGKDEKNRKYPVDMGRLKGEAEEAVLELERTYLERKHAVLEKMREFEVVNDPRENLEHLRDDTPFLLLPVRIETRFKIFTEDGSKKYQLWVRIFPDDIAIDTFEPVLSESEVTASRSYWCDIWRAGSGVNSDNDRKRGAWRSLVTGHGSGRARWITGNYRPENIATPPEKAKAGDVILVMPSDVDLSDEARSALADYWKSIWLADGDKAKEDAALAAYKATGSAEDLIRNFRPVNLQDLPFPSPVKSADRVSVAFIRFPVTGSVDTKKDSWTQPARVNVMPDRFVLIGYYWQHGEFPMEPLVRLGNPIPSPLVIGPDPSAKEGEAICQKDDRIILAEDTAWVVDFQKAVNNGMGFCIDLTPEEFQLGFRRLMVLGVRLCSSAANGRDLLEELIRHHSASRGGFSILPQGTPTNNTEQGSAGYSNVEDADATYRDPFGQGGGFTPVPTSEWLAKPDGQWLAECLGIRPEALADVGNYTCTDQSEARAMNIALWPATLGYFLESMMAPVLDRDTIQKTRSFFNGYVSGRGLVPAIRVGRQPYGILPATAFSRIRWLYGDGGPVIVTHKVIPDPQTDFLRRLYELELKVQADWDTLLQKVDYVGKPTTDPHQMLLNIIGLHSGSVEYFQRYAESNDQLFNVVNLMGFFGGMTVTSGEIASMTSPELLSRYGYSGTVKPDILKKSFLKEPIPVKRPVVDDRPLSEKDPVRAYTPEPKSQNYIEWLIEAANTSYDMIYQEGGFEPNPVPTALLYLMLRHAVSLNYKNAGLELRLAVNLINDAQMVQALREPSFIHIDTAVGRSESNLAYLLTPEPLVTNSPDPDYLVADHITLQLQTNPENPPIRFLSEQLRALDILKKVPTARLERAFAEHIDTATSRLDSWKLGLLHHRLISMRLPGSNEPTRQGIFLGMYGWLENVHSKNKELTEYSPGRILSGIVSHDGDPPIFKDKSNYGYIHAPSLNHAVTAAILRNSYRVNASPENPESFKVNLSSDRVRRALGMVEGIRNGQGLGALLGYQFERDLHERHAIAEVDSFVYELRREFPLAGNRHPFTKTARHIPVRAVEARNVVDGLELVGWVSGLEDKSYPFGRDLPDADDDQKKVINAAVDRLMDLRDAVADLAISESVHQVVQGNYSRTAAALDAYGNSAFPPIPDVIKTPRSGIGLIHRVALHLNGDAAPVAGATPRALAQPALNEWLASVLPDPEKVACHVTLGSSEILVTQKELEIQPIDLLYMLNPESQQAMTALDDLIERYVISHNPVPVTTRVRINYSKRPDGKLPFFEVSALTGSLRALLLRSRALLPNDISMSGEARSDDDKAISIELERIKSPRDKLAGLHDPVLKDFIRNLNDAIAIARPPGAPPDPLNIIPKFDAFVSNYRAAAAIAAGYGIPGTSTGFIHDWIFNIAAAIQGKVRELVDRWQDRLDQYILLMTEYSSQPADAVEARLGILVRAELLVSTSPLTSRPADPEQYRSKIEDRRQKFIDKKTALEATLGPATGISALHKTVFDQLPLSEFDSVPLDLEKEETGMLLFMEDLLSRAQGLDEEIQKRLAAVADHITSYENSSDNSARVGSLASAGSALFGEDFKIIPIFQIPEERRDEWVLAYIDLDNLLKHQKTVEKTDFPVDNWLYSAARVREKLHLWEDILFLTAAFGKMEPELHPCQFPFSSGEPWLALSFPSDTKIKGDRLLYTACYAKGIGGASGNFCGLLLDEWNEVIPDTDETTGVTFHFDRPDSEPPQVLLLVTPPDNTGSWKWKDLIDTLQETLDDAKRRAIEPDFVDDLAYSRFLPATVMQVMYYPIAIAANLALIWKDFKFQTEGNDG
jgi:hypothetical protein